MMATVNLEDEIVGRLKKIQRKGETLEDVIKRLIPYSKSPKTNLKDLSFDELLEEFISLQEGIEKTIENSRKSFSKEWSR